MSYDDGDQSIMDVMSEAYERLECYQETFPGFTMDEIFECNAIAKGRMDLDPGSELFSKLYVLFQDEMPYGTQKARTGDPAQWLGDRLESIFL